MKTTIYRRPDLSYSIHNFPSYTPVQAEFIHTRTIGDFNKISYSKKKLSSTANKTRSQVYYVEFNQPSSKEAGHKMKVEAEFKRGNTFFTEKDGFLFGAYVSLVKMGEIAIISV